MLLLQDVANPELLHKL